MHNSQNTMHKLAHRCLAFVIFLLTVNCVSAQKRVPATRPLTDFVKGADVGFLMGQERRGVKFHDRNGKERECLELLKNDYQMSGIRMRVWVNPRGGNCDKNELLAMAKRVKALGMDLMVDFHYADSWADPAKQPIPAAWQGHSFKQMKRDLREHTIDVLSLLKQNGITPRWVQVGNETANGLLWPMGHIEQNPKQYAGFIRAGYDAVKEVFPETTVIIHLDRGHKQSLYDWNLDIVKKYGGKWDMIGMSLYPYWARKDHPELNADSIITDCMRNIRHCSKKYGCDVMIVETGFEVDEQHPEVMEEGRRQLTRVIREAQTETDGHCRGVFYWEPQCLPGGYKLGAFDSKAAPTAIMEGFVEPTPTRGFPSLQGGVGGGSAPIVQTTGGMISGTVQEGTFSYLGIPYARVERFMPPLPVEKWEGVRACDHFGPQTMQPTNHPMREDEMSEQCCVLNVWTTDTKARKPVMLWLHGGGFDSGTSAWDPGQQLAKKDVVVVSVNHRLNILGFLDLCIGEIQIFGQCGYARCGTGAEVGSRQHRLVRRRPAERHHLWRVGWWWQSGHTNVYARCQGSFPQGNHHERHDSECQYQGNDAGTRQGCS